MSVDIVADKYSTAMFELAKENNILAQIEDDFDYVRTTFAAHPELKGILSNPTLEVTQKISLMQKIFSEAINKLALQLIFVMIKRHRERYIIPAITAYISKSREERGILEAKVTVAKELSATETEQLHVKLHALTGKEVIFDTVIDPSIIGGLVLQIGDKRIDASVERNLNEMKKTLLRAGTIG